MFAIFDFIKYYFQQRYTLLNVSIFLFVFSLVVGGNDLRIGLGFISLIAVSSFLVILFGFNLKGDLNNSNTWICILILAFSIFSYFLNADSFIPFYSTLGNVLLCFSLAQRDDKGESKILIDSIAILFSFIFISYYLGFFWTTFKDVDASLQRRSYLGINPNVIAEYITLSVISLFYLFFKLKRLTRWKVAFVCIMLILLAILPILQTGSRKGITLFLLTIFMFFYLKFRWYQLQRFLGIVVTFAVVITGAFLFLPELDFLQNQVVLKRFQGETFETEAGVRTNLLYMGIKKGLENPIFGHGLEATRDPEFLKSAGLWSKTLNMGINTHNGFVNVFIKGGLVFLLLHILLLLIPMRKLWTMIRKIKIDLEWRDRLILCFLYLVVFVAHIVSSGNGELYKPGWLFLGFAVSQIKLVNKRISIWQWRIRRDNSV